MSSKDIPLITFEIVKCPYSGKEKTVMVTQGTKIWNPHRWDGAPTGSFWRGTEEAPINCGRRSFHVDTNNPSGVLGIFEFTKTCKKGCR